MASTLELEVSTPERLLIRENVKEVQIPGEEGYLGVLPEHAPLLSRLGYGVMWYVSESGERKYLSVAAGFLEVLPDKVRILADRAEPATEIDVERARFALERAQSRIANPAVGIDIARALSAARRAQARLAAAGYTNGVMNR
ncbi:MAG: F0F1 ATP synthase subunit epsilon [Bryobacteraceae bacterium]